MNMQPKNATRTQGERRKEAEVNTSKHIHLNKNKKNERTIGDAKRGERGRRKEEYKHKRKKN